MSLSRSFRSLGTACRPSFLGLIPRATASIALPLLAAIGISARAAQAAPITYTIEPISLINATAVTLTGTITTDGAMGTLAASDITSWQWQVVGGTTSFSASGPPNASVFVENVIATATQLSLPFLSLPAQFPADIGGELILQSGPTAPSFELTTNSGLNFNDTADYAVFSQVGIPAVVGYKGLVDFGSTEPSSPTVFATVPEPASLVLLGLGAISLAAIARRRRRNRLA